MAADPRFVHILLQVLTGRVVYRTNRRNGVDFDVLVCNVASGAEEVLYDGGGLVAEAMLSPDSRYLALTVLSRRPMSTQLLLVDTLAATPDARLRELTVADEHARYENLHWLPDSSGVVLTTDRDTDHTFVARYDLANDELSVLVAAEHDVTAWSSPDGRSLLAETNVDGWSALALVDVEGGGRREVRLPTPGVLAGSLPAPVFAPDSSTVALSVSAPGVPGDVLLLDVATVSVRALTDTAVPGVAAPTSHVVPTPDGEQVPCYVYRPTVATDLAGSSVTVVHGGPEGQSRPAFSPVVQALVAAGHTVLVPNVRGSVGYGKRWYSLDDVGLRLDSVADLAAVHDWLPSLGLDPGRAALWGGSYGGVHGAGRVCVPAAALGRGGGHRRHLVAGHVLGEHLGLPPGRQGAGVRHARRRPGILDAGVAAEPHRRPAGATGGHPRGQRSPGAADRGAATAHRAHPAWRAVRAAGVPRRGPRSGQTGQPGGRLPKSAGLPGQAAGLGAG